MLMFQQTSARDRCGSSSRAARSMWLTGSGGARPAARDQQSPSTSSWSFRYRKPAPGGPMLPVSRRQQRDTRARRCRRSAGAAAPGRSRAATGPRRRSRAARSIRLGRHAGRPPRPTPGVHAASSGSSSSQPTVCSARNVAVDQPVAARSRASARRPAPRRCPGRAGGGCRRRRPSGCGSGRPRSPRPGASPSQCSCWCGPDADGFAPQTTMHAASRAVRGSKPVTELP